MALCGQLYMETSITLMEGKNWPTEALLRLHLYICAVMLLLVVLINVAPCFVCNDMGNLHSTVILFSRITSYARWP